MTMQVITKTDMFSAAVSHAGISALTSYWGEGYWGYLYSSVATAESFPWNRRDIYVEHSPLFHADKVKTPILLTHGDADPNVPPGESDQFFIALRLLDVPVEYLRFSGQQHFVLDHDQRVRWSRSIVAWFDRWLKEQPEWWDELYPAEKDE
jgi:dipeptidyl aminopeptidase/acylaminoacyl peptidase